MYTLARVLGIVAIVALLAFCCFGFLATFEPMDVAMQVAFRVLYGAGAVACVGGVWWLALGGRRV